MRSSYFFALVAFFVFNACSNSSKPKDETTIAVEQTSSAFKVIDVATLLSNPDAYDGKQVALKGTVVHVCKHSGKRLHLLGSDEQTRIRVEAGEIGKFDRELEGSEIVAKGVFRRNVIDEEYLAKWADELEKEGRGEHNNHEEQQAEQGRMQRYQEMMGENSQGQSQNFWVDGISFETVDEEAAI